MPRLLSSLLLCLLLSLPVHAERLQVVASFSILADLCREIGGERVDVRSLIQPGGDAHAYQPSPADARAIADADLVVINGLGFEGWIERLLESTRHRGDLVVASDGARLIEGSGRSSDNADDDQEGHGLDPHAWQDLSNARIYARNIALALARADLDGAPAYLSRYRTYATRLEALDIRFRARFATVPEARRRVVTSHDAFGYLGRAYGLTFVAPVGRSSGSHPSAAGLAALIRQIREQHISAAFVENIADTRLVEQIQRETGARIGGTLYSDSLSPAGGDASTYLQMMTHNLETLADALHQ
ncbi:MAG: zinc ABC transporter substrate-binding protein [Rhodocyclaceae bacterium]|nr:zinc ABC transporter substrate-binding protein [Rhodocyclaceae bacterium]